MREPTLAHHVREDGQAGFVMTGNFICSGLLVMMFMDECRFVGTKSSLVRAGRPGPYAFCAVRNPFLTEDRAAGRDSCRRRKIHRKL